MPDVNLFLRGPIALSHDLAGRAGIPVLLGIQTAANSKMHLGPKPDDLLELRSAVAAHSTQTVWLHRPELYWKHVRRLQLRGILRVVGERDRFDGAWPTRSLLRYDPEQHVFLSSLTWWGKPARAQCHPPECAVALQDDLRDGSVDGIDEAPRASRYRPVPRNG